MMSRRSGRRRDGCAQTAAGIIETNPRRAEPGKESKMNNRELKMREGALMNKINASTRRFQWLFKMAGGDMMPALRNYRQGLWYDMAEKQANHTEALRTELRQVVDALKSH
jgi:hypothetical protein